MGNLIRNGMLAFLSLAIVIALAAPAGAASPKVTAIAATNSTSMALMDDGSVWQWGYTARGDVEAPLHVEGISDIKAIAAGYGHSLALKSDGTVWAWGSNVRGQLGDGTSIDRTSPVRVSNLSGVIAIAAGKDHSMALKDDGTVWAWGYNVYGQLGSGMLSYDGSNVPVQVKNVTGVVAISCGNSRSMAVRGDGTLWVWGENRHGALGDGTNESRLAPAAVKASDIRSVDAGDSWHAIAVKNDNTVWAWGYNYKGQLGSGGISPGDMGSSSTSAEPARYSPGTVYGLSGVKSVSSGGSHSVALKSDGTVWTWGGNDDGQLGIGAMGGSDRTSPVEVTGLEKVVAVATGMYHTLALTDNGFIWAWGSNSDGQLGNESIPAQASSPVLVPIGTQSLPTAVATATSYPTIDAYATVPSTPTPQSAGFGPVIVLLALAIVAACVSFKKQ